MATSNNAYTTTNFSASNDRRQQLLDDPELAKRLILDALSFLEETNLSLPLLLDLICYGCLNIVSDPKIRWARTSVVQYDHLADLLDRMCTPPRTSAGGARSEGASAIMKPWARQVTMKDLGREMQQINRLLKSPLQEFSTEHLLDIHLDKIMKEIKTEAPSTWEVLKSLSWTEQQQSRNTLKTPDWVRCPFQIDSRLPLTALHSRFFRSLVSLPTPTPTTTTRSQS